MKNISTSTGLEMNHKAGVVYKTELYFEERTQIIENVVANRPNPSNRMLLALMMPLHD